MRIPRTRSHQAGADSCSWMLDTFAHVSEVFLLALARSVLRKSPCMVGSWWDCVYCTPYPFFLFLRDLQIG